MFRKQTLREAAAETTHTAAERGAAALEAAIERLQPLLEQAAEKVAPLADDALKRADHARLSAAKYAADTLDSVQPQINEALDKVSPAVEKAQRAVQQDFIPKLIELLREASEHPAVVGILEEAREAVDEVETRGGAALAAAKGELERPRRSKGRTFVRLAVVGALLGAVAVAVRTFLGSKDQGWAPHQPSPAYTYTDTPTPKEPEPEPEPVDDVSEDVEDTLDETVIGETATAEPSLVFGEGSYVGAEPPEGFTIKGNDRSMKYHLPESGGYDRTNADVWFNSEEAAQQAGFSRAQR
ncbi:MAG: hypothetical protein HY829_05185 [Actinobacteria bacterium]|nr:hypothetical protein [Actinomycetota bacterium]